MWTFGAKSLSRSVCGGGDDGFVVLAGEFLEVVGDDFGGVAVKCAGEFV
jgi:hypothetical protein